jgi:hypothetical protein
MWVLGVLLVLFSMCAIGSSVFLLRTVRRGGAGGGVSYPAFFQLIGSLVYLVPGLLYIVFAIFAKQRQLWAVIAALVLASIQCLFVLATLVTFTFVVLAPNSGAPTAVFIPLALLAFVAVALAQLIYHLAKSFEAIRHPPFGREEHGFEPLGVRPAVPFTPNEGEFRSGQ